MEKPKPIERNPVLDYNDIIDFIEEKYNIKTRDYAGRFTSHSKIVQQTNEKFGNTTWYYSTGLDKMNEIEKEAHTYYTELYKPFTDLPYLDYWHWLLDNAFGEVSNGSTADLPILEMLEDKDAPEWVLEITQYIHDEFSEHINQYGCIDVLIEW